MKINLANIIYDSIVDGVGIRNVFFTQGCPHNCVSCHNPETIPIVENKLTSVDDLIAKLLKTKNKNLTLSGGEPFIQAENCYYLTKKLKQENFNIWLYTGFTYETLLNSKNKYHQLLLKQLDVLVDGRFEIRNKSLNLMYKGSTNQRVIDVQKSLKAKCVVLYKFSKNNLDFQRSKTFV